MNLENKTILISGGGSGIGLAIAKRLNIPGNKVIICGRNEEKLRIVAEQNGFFAIPCDITNDEAQELLFDTIRQQFGHLDVLINNAGVMHVYNFSNESKTLLLIEHEITLNCTAQLKMTFRALPLLKMSKEPAVVFVSSGTAYIPSPLSIVYTGTKSLLHHFSENLRVQLKPTGIKVFELLPPPTETDMAGKVKSKVDMSRFSFIKAEEVANALYYGMRENKYEILVGLSKVMKIVSRLAPQFLFKQMSKIVPE